MNEYSWIYNTSPSNSSRFTLGNCGHSPLLCIGVNPSTAVPENLDPTLKSVARIADNNSYDGWIMINLYPSGQQILTDCILRSMMLFIRKTWI